MQPKRLVILASGSGSNVENLITYYKDNPAVSIAMVLTNKKDAPVLDRCARLKVGAVYFNPVAFSKTDGVLDLLKGLRPDLIVLAGFLLRIPKNLLRHFPDRIINIHPSLLPKYGGKGMYGQHVHEAVKKNGESETGITIHYVNENYDEGAIIYQASTALDPKDSVASIAAKVHTLEFEHLPKTIDRILTRY